VDKLVNKASQSPGIPRKNRSFLSLPIFLAYLSAFIFNHLAEFHSDVFTVNAANSYKKATPGITGMARL
jgi:hypothetical protein